MNYWDDDNRSVSSVASLGSVGSVGSKASLVSLASKKSFQAAIEEFLPKQSQKSYEIGNFGALIHEELESNRITNMVKRDVKQIRNIYSCPSQRSKKVSDKKRSPISPLQRLLENVSKLPALTLGLNEEEHSDKPVDIVARPVLQSVQTVIAAERAPEAEVKIHSKAKLDPMSVSGKLFLPLSAAIPARADSNVSHDVGASSHNDPGQQHPRLSSKVAILGARSSSKQSRLLATPSAQVVSPTKDSLKVLPTIDRDINKNEVHDKGKGPAATKKEVQSPSTRKKQQQQSRLSRVNVKEPTKFPTNGKTRDKSTSIKNKTGTDPAPPNTAGTQVVVEVKEPEGDIPSFCSSLRSPPEVAMWGNQSEVYDYHTGNDCMTDSCGDTFRFSSAEEGHMWGGNHLEEKKVDHKHKFCFNVNSSSADEVHIWGAHGDTEEETTSLMTRRASRAQQDSQSGGFMPYGVNGVNDTMNIWAADHDALSRLRSIGEKEKSGNSSNNNSSGNVKGYVKARVDGAVVPAPVIRDSSYRMSVAGSPRVRACHFLEHGAEHQDWSELGHGDMQEVWIEEDDTDYLDAYGSGTATVKSDSIDQRSFRPARFSPSRGNEPATATVPESETERMSTESDNAATKVQALFRGKSVRNRKLAVSTTEPEPAEPKADGAATKMQALFRGKSVRNRKLAVSTTEPEPTEPKPDGAATKVQALFRGKSVRNRKPPPGDPPAVSLVTRENTDTDASANADIGVQGTVGVNSSDGICEEHFAGGELSGIDSDDSSGVPKIRRRTPQAKKTKVEKPYACKHPGCNKRYFLAWDLTIHEKNCSYITAGIANSYRKSHKVPTQFQIVRKDNWRRHLPEGFK